MAIPKGKSWKLERSRSTPRGKTRPHSHKYSKSDSDKRPAPGRRQRVWVGGYTRSDGSHVKGYYRAVS